MVFCNVQHNHLNINLLRLTQQTVQERLATMPQISASPQRNTPGFVVFILKIRRLALSLQPQMDSLKEKTAKGLVWGLMNNGTTQLLNLVFGHYERHKEIHSYFSNQLRPIETVVPTIAFNTPHAKCCTLHIGNFTSMSDLMPLHFMVASQSGYKILDERNYHKIVSSGMMFVRGVNSSSSSMLLNMIDKYRAASATVE